jgi:hypothetical protein
MKTLPISNRNPGVEQGIQMYHDVRNIKAANETISQPAVYTPQQSFSLFIWIKAMFVLLFTNWGAVSPVKCQTTKSKTRRPPARPHAKVERKKSPSKEVPGLKQGDLTRALFALQKFLDEYLKKTGVRQRMQEGTTTFEFTHGGIEGNLFRFHYHFFDPVKNKVCHAEFDVVPGSKTVPTEVKIIKDFQTGRKSLRWEPV